MLQPRHFCFWVVFSLLGMRVPASGQCTLDSRQELTSGLLQAGDQAGFDVGADGEWIVVGAWSDDTLGTDAGAAYVFRRQASTWVLAQKLTAFDGEADDCYGWKVAVSGDRLAVGARKDDERGCNAGAVHVYRFDGTSWVNEQKLMASDGRAGDSLGAALAMRGDRLIVGAAQDDYAGGSPGYAYVFRRTGVVWHEEARLEALDGQVGNKLGFAVDVEDDRAVVSALVADHGGLRSGAVYTFQMQAGTWQQEQKLLPADPGWNQQFGFSLSLDGSRLAVGTRLDDEGAVDAGAVYLFAHDGSVWRETQKLVAADANDFDHLGIAVSLEDDLLAVGAYLGDDFGADSGSAYLFRDLGSAFQEETRLHAQEGEAGSHFGRELVLAGDVLVVGGNRDPTQGLNAGGAWVFVPPEISFAVAPAAPLLGDTVTLTGCGGEPGKVALVFVTSVDGIPVVWRLPVLGQFDAEGRWQRGGPLLTSPGAFDLTLQLVSLRGPASLVTSAPATLTLP